MKKKTNISCARIVFDRGTWLWRNSGVLYCRDEFEHQLDLWLQSTLHVMFFPPSDSCEQQWSQTTKTLLKYEMDFSSCQTFSVPVPLPSFHLVFIFVSFFLNLSPPDALTFISLDSLLLLLKVLWLAGVPRLPMATWCCPLSLDLRSPPDWCKC